jgi:crotonobetainyl-CoA:carnitine CoA-transferase CaiB-like acyl-CoA transferase
MDLTGEPGDPPEKTGLSLVDYAGGYVAVISLLAALHGARRDGIGTDCDVSLYDTAISLLNYVATWALTKGYTPTRTKHSAHPSLVPFQNFETANGWIVLACPKEKFWRRLVDVLDLDELHDISYFGSFAARHEHKDEVLALIAARLRERTSEEWLELFESVGVPCGPVNTVAEALKDPQIEARGLVAETTHPVFGKIRQPTGAARVGPPGADLPRHRRAPLRNEDAHYILAEVLEYNTDHIDSLAIEGAFGPYDNYKATDSLNSQ